MPRIKVSDLEIEETTPRVVYVPKRVFEGKPIIYHISKALGLGPERFHYGRQRYTVTLCNRALNYVSIANNGLPLVPGEHGKLCPQCGDQADFDAAVAEHKAKLDEAERRREARAAERRRIYQERQEIEASCLDCFFKGLEIAGYQIDREHQTVTQGAATFRVELADAEGMPELPQ